jgi:hypothetical protein
MNIFVATEKYFYHSSNSGSSWDSVDLSGIKSSSDIPFSIYFPNNNTGFITLSHLGSPFFLLKTTNSGNNWSKFIVDSTDSFNMLNVHFIDSLHGLISATAERLFYTSDGGNTWKKYFVSNGTTPGNELDLIKPYYFNNNEACALADGGTVRKIMINSSIHAATGITPISFSNENTRIFPNPTSDYLTIECLDCHSIKQVKLYDITMKEFSNYLINSSRTQIDIRDMPCGSYFLQIIGENNSSKWAPVQILK